MFPRPVDIRRASWTKVEEWLAEGEWLKEEFRVHFSRGGILRVGLVRCGDSGVGKEVSMKCIQACHLGKGGAALDDVLGVSDICASSPGLGDQQASPSSTGEDAHPSQRHGKSDHRDGTEQGAPTYSVLAASYIRCSHARPLSAASANNWRHLPPTLSAPSDTRHEQHVASDLLASFAADPVTLIGPGQDAWEDVIHGMFDRLLYEGGRLRNGIEISQFIRRGEMGMGRFANWLEKCLLCQIFHQKWWRITSSELFRACFYLAQGLRQNFCPSPSILLPNPENDHPSPKL
ncbi:hypothetical protein B0H10DRAFT_1937946 [Mycena sp. CBHHK59/15]|nr:hypothetical protein B0H10DRAFT_1937946 [Mycena sp. CBHHK59/15]